MACVPDLPDGIEEWIDGDLLLKSRYLLYQYTGKKTQAAPPTVPANGSNRPGITSFMLNAPPSLVII